MTSIYPRHQAQPRYIHEHMIIDAICRDAGVNGKSKAKVEFGSKAGVCIVNGYAFIDFSRKLTKIKSQDDFNRKNNLFKQPEQ